MEVLVFAPELMPFQPIDAAAYASVYIESAPSNRCWCGRYGYAYGGYSSSNPCRCCPPTALQPPPKKTFTSYNTGSRAHGGPPRPRDGRGALPQARVHGGDRHLHALGLRASPRRGRLQRLFLPLPRVSVMHACSLSSICLIRFSPEVCYALLYTWCLVLSKMVVQTYSTRKTFISLRLLCLVPVRDYDDGCF